MTTRLLIQAITKFLLGIVLVGLLIFSPAGTFSFINGWLLMGILFVPMFLAGIVMMFKNPELLKKRLNAKEKQKEGRTYKMKELLDKILKVCTPYIEQGKLASYIPELAKANKNEFGICVVSDKEGMEFSGDYDKGFTMQSVAKPMILLMALMDNGAECVRNLVGVEATGKPFDAFNYSDQALNKEHINPMINTGAIVLCSLIKGDSYEERFFRLLDLTRKVSGNAGLEIDEQVYLSEKATGNKNRALAYMLKAYGMMEDDVEEVLDCYFRACSIKVTTVDLARIAYVFAHGGVNPETGERIFEKEYARYVNAVLMTCGMYDGSGEFAIKVGVPAKSGVGGGIMAVVPGRMGIGIYSPALDKNGNSFAGRKALELLSENLELSIF